MIKTTYVDGTALAAAELNDGFSAIKGYTPGGELHQYNEKPAYNGSAGVFKTTFPYVSGTLQVYVEYTVGTKFLGRQIKSYNYNETTPTTGVFTFSIGPGAAAVDSDSPYIRVDYVRSNL